MKHQFMMGAVACALSAQALAAVSAEEAAQLGKTLTPVGAIAAGNKEGTIPPFNWNEAMNLKAPAGYQHGKTQYLDPFPNDKPRLVITAKNMAEHADKLSENTKEMFKRFPDTFRIDVYPTRRTGVTPKFYEENSVKNATRCKLTENGLAVENCFGGSPFPIPKNGYEQMWNVNMAFRFHGESFTTGVYVDTTGNPVVSGKSNSLSTYPFLDRKSTIEKFTSENYPYRLSTSLTTAPARVAGDGTMALLYTNPVKFPNKGYGYQQGQRRVRVSPTVEYDFPIATSGGTFFFDEVNLWSGKMDRFDFKLLGVKELYIPYNTHKWVVEDDLSKLGSQAAKGRHYNPDLMRWELHRVRVVEATLKPGMRHAYSKRVFYIDDDTSASGLVDTYDQGGKPYRLILGTPYGTYEPHGLYAGEFVSHDFSTGIWASLAHQGGNPPSQWGTDAQPHEGWPHSAYTPEGMQRRHSR